MLLESWGFGFVDFGEATERIVFVFVENAVEDVGLEFAIGTPNVVAFGDGFALVVGGDDGFGVAVGMGFVADDPAVEETLGGELERGFVVVIPDLWDVVDGDLGVAVEEVVLVTGFLEEGWLEQGQRGRDVPALY